MFGSTNSQNIIQSGGGGDKVYAINNTGADIVTGQKVWLNKHNLDENVAYQFKRSAKYEELLSVFDNDNNVILYNKHGTATSGCSFHKYNTETKQWDFTTISQPSKSLWFPGFIRQINGESICLTTSQISYDTEYFSFIIDTNMNTAYNGIYLGNNFELLYTATNTLVIKFPSGNTYPLEGFSSKISAAYKTDDKLFVLDSNGLYKIYQFNEFFEGAPTVLKEKTTTLFKDNYPIQFFTGIGPNEYLLLQYGNKQNNVNSNPSILIYKFDSDYNIVEATDLQEDLKNLIGTKGFLQYYNDYNILTVGTIGKVYLFKYENNNFTNLNIDIQLPTDQDTTNAYRFYISKDMTSAVICYKYTTGYAYTAIAFYKLKTASEDWYADTYPQFSSNTLTGYATGNTDSEGRYEVSTVLGVS